MKSNQKHINARSNLILKYTRISVNYCKFMIIVMNSVIIADSFWLLTCKWRKEINALDAFTLSQFFLFGFSILVGSIIISLLYKVIKNIENKLVFKCINLNLKVSSKILLSIHKTYTWCPLSGFNIFHRINIFIHLFGIILYYF